MRDRAARETADVGEDERPVGRASEHRSPVIQASRIRVHLARTQVRIGRLSRQISPNARELASLRTLQAGLARELDYWVGRDLDETP